MASGGGQVQSQRAGGRVGEGVPICEPVSGCRVLNHLIALQVSGRGSYGVCCMDGWRAVQRPGAQLPQEGWCWIQRNAFFGETH